MEFACHACNQLTPALDLLLCPCKKAFYCSNLCYGNYIAAGHDHIGPKRPEEDDDDDDNPSKRQKTTGILKAEVEESKKITRVLEAANAKKPLLERYRALQEDARTTFEALNKVFKLLRPPEYYPNSLSNQSDSVQPRLDLLGDPENPTIVTVLSSAQRLLADSYGPWSGIRGAEVDWQTGVGKTILLHVIGKNYRHESVPMPGLVVGDEPEVLQPRIVIIVTESQLKADVMKDRFAQNNRDTEWICNQIKAVGLCCNEEPSPFTSLHVLSGRQLTNAMAGRGPIGRALWSGLYPSEEGLVIRLKEYPRAPNAYREVVDKDGNTVWVSHNMNWSEEAPKRQSALELSVSGILRPKSIGDISNDFTRLLIGFPVAGQSKSTWTKQYRDVTVTTLKRGKNNIFKVVVTWKGKVVPSDNRWETYLANLLIHIRTNWPSLKELTGRAIGIKSAAVNLEQVVQGENGYELFRKPVGKYGQVKYEWRRRREAVDEVRYNPFNRVTLLVDEAQKFFEPTVSGGGVPNLQLFNTVVDESPDMRLFYFTATPDFLVSSGIQRTLVPKVDAVDINRGTALPAVNVARVPIPTFPQTASLTFGQLTENGKGLIVDGEFDPTSVYIIKNAIKGLYSRANDDNRDFFASTIRNEPVSYELPLVQAEMLAELIGSGSRKIGEAMIFGGEVQPRHKLNNREYNPTKVTEELLMGSNPLAAYGRVLLLQLRKNDQSSRDRIGYPYTKLYKQAVYSTLQEDSKAIDVVASLMQAVGYQWVKAIRRRINRAGWSDEKLELERQQRRSGRVGAEFREVVLDFDSPALSSTADEVVKAAYGPVGDDRRFVVLSESLITDDGSIIEPQNEAEVAVKVVTEKNFATGFQFKPTVTELKENGLVFTGGLERPVAPPELPEGASRTEAAEHSKAVKEYESAMQEYKEVSDDKPKKVEFNRERSRLTKRQLYYWPGSGHFSDDELNSNAGSEFAMFKRVTEPRWFIKQFQTDEESGDNTLTPRDITDFLAQAGPVTFDVIRRLTLFNFFMSDNEQQDLLSCITENYNTPENAYGSKIRFLLFGGNYVQGFDAKDTLFTTACHPSVDRTVEIQALGRTNRRNGMLNIPFNERKVTVTTLYAKWPTGFKSPTLNGIFRRADDQEDDEERYGKMKSEMAVVTAIDEDPVTIKNTRALEETDRLAPYSLWRALKEDPSVTAVRLSGNELYRKMAIDSDFSKIKMDEENPDSPTVYSPKWKVGSTMWSINKRAVQRQLVSIRERITAAEEASSEKQESMEEYEARILAKASALPVWNVLDENTRRLIVKGLENDEPFALVASGGKNDGMIKLKTSESALKNLIELYEGGKTEILLHRRWAIENRFLLIPFNPTPKEKSFITLMPEWFDFTGPLTGFLTHLYEIDAVNWTPQIKKISTVEIADEEDDNMPDPKRTKVQEMFAVNVGFCSPDPDAIEAVSKKEPYSNVLEAIGTLDSEQKTIEKLQETRDSGFRQNPIEFLKALGFWNNEVPAEQNAQIQAIYAKYTTQANELKLAIMELTKFGVTIWARALYLICGVYTSDKITGPTALLSVAQLIGTLYYTCGKPGFEVIFTLLLDQETRPEVLNLPVLRRFFRLLFQWSASYTPFESAESRFTLSAELTDLAAILSQLVRDLNLDIFSDLEVIKSALLRAPLPGKTTLSNRTVPPQDTFEFLVEYVRRRKPKAKPMTPANWTDYKYAAVIVAYADLRDIIKARDTGKKLSNKALTKIEYALRVLEIGPASATLETLPIIFLNVTKIKKLLEMIWGARNSVIKGNPYFDNIMGIFNATETIGVVDSAISKLIRDGFKDKVDPKEIKARLKLLTDSWSSSEATGFKNKGELVFKTNTGDLVIFKSDGSAKVLGNTSDLEDLYKAGTVIFTESDFTLPKKFVNVMAEDLANLASVAGSGLRSTFLSHFQKRKNMSKLLLKRTYSVVVDVLDSELEDFKTSDFSKMVIPSGRRFSRPTLKTIHGLLLMFDGNITLSDVATLPKKRWMSKKKFVIAEHLPEMLLALSRNQTFVTFGQRFQDLNKLYTIIESKEIFADLSRVAEAATKPGITRSKTNPPPPPRQPEWQKDNSQIWMAAPSQFLSRWKSQFARKYGGTLQPDDGSGTTPVTFE